MGNVAQRGHAGLELEAMRRHQSARLIRGEGEEYYGYQYPDNATRLYGAQDQRRGSCSFYDPDKSVTGTDYSDVLHVSVHTTRVCKMVEAINAKRKMPSGWQTFNQEGTDGRPLHLHSILLAAALTYVLATL